MHPPGGPGAPEGELATSPLRANKTARCLVRVWFCTEKTMHITRQVLIARALSLRSIFSRNWSRAGGHQGFVHRPRPNSSLCSSLPTCGSGGRAALIPTWNDCTSQTLNEYPFCLYCVCLHLPLLGTHKVAVHPVPALNRATRHFPPPAAHARALFICARLPPACGCGHSHGHTWPCPCR